MQCFLKENIISIISIIDKIYLHNPPIIFQFLINYFIYNIVLLLFILNKILID